MRARACLATLTAAAIAVGVGCGGSSTPAAKAPTNTAAAGLPSEAKLRTALLTEKDLPAGWTEVDAGSAATGLCGAPPLEAPVVQKVRTAFGSTQGSTEILQQGLTAYPKGEAATVLARLTERLADCTSYSVEVTDPRTGKPATFTVGVQPLAVPAVGDERVGITLTVKGRGDVTLYSAVRRGDVIGVLALTGKNPGEKAFSDLLGTADRRMEDLGK